MATWGWIRRWLAELGAAVRRLDARWTYAAVVLLCAGLIVALEFYSKHLFDEGFHHGEIENLRNGRFERNESLTMIPAYHAGIAGVLTVLGKTTLLSARGVSLAVSLLCIPALYALARRFWPPEHAIERTVQTCALPIILPLFPLLYTDLWSLLAVVMMLALALSGRPGASAAVGLAAFALRQSNLVWLGAACVLLLHDIAERGVMLSRRELLGRAVCALWPFVLVLSIIGAFIVVNGGLLWGQRAEHAPGLNLSQLYFFLIVMFLLFLPLFAAQSRRVVALIRRHPVILLVVIAGGVLFVFTYRIEHQFNHIPEYWRNRMLMWSTSSWWTKTIAYLAAVWTILAMAVMKLPRARYYWLYPLAIVSLVLLPVIEQRYYIPLVVAFSILRPRQASSIERCQILWAVAGTSLVAYSFMVLHVFL